MKEGEGAHVVQDVLLEPPGGGRGRPELLWLVAGSSCPGLVRAVSQLVKLVLGEPFLPVVHCRGPVAGPPEHPHLGELPGFLRLPVANVLLVLLLLLVKSSATLTLRRSQD